jgi:tripartite-type tricarboxylate transporter receptor subunit TctC
MTRIYVLALFAALIAGSVAADDAWPSRPVKFVVPTPPGGGTDIYARLIAAAVAANLKAPFLVENRPGGGGNIGVEAVARSPADGTVFLVSATGFVTVNPALYKNLTYSVERDLVPVTRGVGGPLVILVPANSQSQSLADLIQAAKRDSSTVSYGSAGTGSLSNLGVRMLEEASGARFLHVPYKGVGQVYQDLLGGQLHFMLADLASAIPHIKSGKARALALTEPTSSFPHVPSFADAGYSGLPLSNYFSVFAPGGTSPAVVRKLGSEIGRAMKDAALAEKLAAQALTPVFDTPEDFAGVYRRELQVWRSFIERNGIKVD